MVAPLDASLRNLKTDRIDIYRSHRPEEIVLENPIKHSRVPYSAMQVDPVKSGYSTSARSMPENSTLGP